MSSVSGQVETWDEGYASVIISGEGTGQTILSTIQDSFYSAIYSVEFWYSTNTYTFSGLSVTIPDLTGTTLTTRTELIVESSATITNTPPSTIAGTESAVLTSSASASSSKDAGNTIVGVVAGAVGGCAAFFFAVGAMALCFFVRRRRRRARQRQQESDEAANATIPNNTGTETTAIQQTADPGGRLEPVEPVEKQLCPDKVNKTPDTSNSRSNWPSPFAELGMEHVPFELEASPASCGTGGIGQPLQVQKPS
ncbi:hypothetical protein PMZ80_000909 [Knufia obscura]|uniref:Uncharacterized protein n=1 Tax=Knufia obscura TaxID=1635080 RepID=A0ABR0S1R7_9EURO|nr:hypothetical protein PMZ80_000909 [Knufia obscura]